MRISYRKTLYRARVFKRRILEMKTINIVNGPQNFSAIIQGCMRMPDLTKEATAKVIRTAYDCEEIYRMIV